MAGDRETSQHSMTSALENTKEVGEKGINMFMYIGHLKSTFGYYISMNELSMRMTE